MKANQLDLIINIVWAVVMVIITLTAAFYIGNKSKIEKIRLKHPRVAAAMDFLGKTSIKAVEYQFTQDKEGSQKLLDATDEVYEQAKKVYPDIPITEETARNFVQGAYNQIKASQDQVVVQKPEIDSKNYEKIEVPKVTDPITTKPEETPKSESKDVILDDLHL